MKVLQQFKSDELKGSTKFKLANGLTEFPRELFDLTDTLELLDLSGNSLSSLPDHFDRFQKLKIVFFADNQFTEFPKILSQCPQLEMISFKSNRISKIEEGAIPKQTRWLILTNNQINELPKSIGNCSRLQKCALAGNQLTSLPIEMANCQNLELLRISANQLTEFPEWLLQLPKLSWLAISGNTFNKNYTVHNSLPKINWQDLELKEILGEGASGIISKAVYNATNEIAVKVFKGEVTSDGLPHDEMSACIEAGDHAHLVKLLGQINKHPENKEGLALELIPNDYKNLGLPPNFVTCTRDTFHENTSFSLEHIKSIAIGISTAMEHLHANGVMHGDLYAHNILINDQAHALLGDFGAATIYDTNSNRAPLLEKLDVRAFSCLLEDLLDHTIPGELHTQTYNSLHQLKENCMLSEISNRPDFKTISSQISQLS